MKKSLLLGFILSVFVTGSVFAAEAKPVLKKANIEVSLAEDGIHVKEQITLANVESIKSGKIEHILTRFPNAEIKNLEIKAGDQKLTVESNKGSMMDKILVARPESAKGDLTYSIVYSYPRTSNISKIPLVLPAVSTDGTGNVVSIKLELPKGMYLQDSFPIFDGAESGTIQGDMMNFPNFLSLDLGSSPPGLLSESNLYTLFGLVVILGFIIAWLYNERRAKTGGVVNV